MQFDHSSTKPTGLQQSQTDDHVKHTTMFKSCTWHCSVTKSLWATTQSQCITVNEEQRSTCPYHRQLVITYTYVANSIADWTTPCPITCRLSSETLNSTHSFIVTERRKSKHVNNWRGHGNAMRHYYTLYKAVLDFRGDLFPKMGCPSLSLPALPSLTFPLFPSPLSGPHPKNPARRPTAALWAWPPSTLWWILSWNPAFRDKNQE